SPGPQRAQILNEQKQRLTVQLNQSLNYRKVSSLLMRFKDIPSSTVIAEMGDGRRLILRDQGVEKPDILLISDGAGEDVILSADQLDADAHINITSAALSDDKRHLAIMYSVNGATTYFHFQVF